MSFYPASPPVSVRWTDGLVYAFSGVLPGAYPAPVLHEPYRLTQGNGSPLFSLNLAGANVVLHAQLSDSPPEGVSTALDLTGATVTGRVQDRGGRTVLLSVGGYVTSGTQARVDFIFTSEGLAQLTGGEYKMSALATFASGQTVLFEGLWMKVSGVV